MLKKSTLVYSFLLTIFIPVLASAGVKKEFYQIKIYHLKSQVREQIVDEFLEKAYLPALHRLGIKNVGVFKPIASTEMLIYVFIPFKVKGDLFKLESQLQKDRKYLENGKTYLEAPFNETPYERIETILLNAFDKQPSYNLPKLNSPKKERVYELRSYEGHTEKISANKIKMFNDGGEIGLFKRLGFNAVFYAEVIAGSTMPNLMYLTTFENKADRDAHWSSFGKDSFWKTLSALPEYKNNVSKNVTKFLYPTDYSDI